MARDGFAVADLPVPRPVRRLARSRRGATFVPTSWRTPTAPLDSCGNCSPPPTPPPPPWISPSTPACMSPCPPPGQTESAGHCGVTRARCRRLRRRQRPPRRPSVGRPTAVRRMDSGRHLFPVGPLARRPPRSGAPANPPVRRLPRTSHHRGLRIRRAHLGLWDQSLDLLASRGRGPIPAATAEALLVAGLCARALDQTQDATAPCSTGLRHQRRRRACTRASPPPCQTPSSASSPPTGAHRRPHRLLGPRHRTRGPQIRPRAGELSAARS